ncbi:hypothetical protein M404DRAFT_1007913 [Pisolithus tinctorius Marx 270]|uniref:Uncharacterized protein n=1 Tax=Pisolithus tinctorius Marx 270 TaxID=870435 RepID=A0A0C3NHJ0_PISTI|nr:hypothetical protein M404DRAFT_1007913 [Pisolithus tinctorius Marx 270]
MLQLITGYSMRAFTGRKNARVAESIAQPAALAPPLGAAFTPLLPMTLLHCGKFAIRSLFQD